MGKLLYIYKGYMATVLMRVSSKMRGRLGLFAPATSQNFVLACYPRQWLIFCISYWLHFLSLFLIPECLDLSTASWRVAHSVMSHSDNLFASARQFDMSNQAFISANPRVTCCTLRRPICFSIGVCISSGPGSACFLCKYHVASQAQTCAAPT